MLPNFGRFLSVASKHTNLIVDLCNETDTISRAQLLHYMQQSNIPPAQKDAAIDELCKANILLIESDDTYTVNGPVAELVSYYERRGRLTSAAFLRDQIIQITRFTEELQRLLAAEQHSKDTILDAIDNLYLLVRDVREAGASHYQACMRTLGDLERSGASCTVEERLIELDEVQRRHIKPLRELIDPDAAYSQQIAALRRRLFELGTLNTLLADSQELASRRQRLAHDLHYIDHTLMRGFSRMVDTARNLLHSLLEQRELKDALAYCLGNLDVTWQALHGRTIIATGRTFSQAPPALAVSEFVADIMHRRLLPNPKPLVQAEVHRQQAEELLIDEDRLWECVQREGLIESWPSFVVRQFNTYSSNEQIKAIVAPLVTNHQHVRVQQRTVMFAYDFADVTAEMRDFAVRWEDGYEQRSITTPRNLPAALSGIPI